MADWGTYGDWAGEVGGDVLYRAMQNEWHGSIPTTSRANSTDRSAVVLAPSSSSQALPILASAYSALGLLYPGGIKDEVNNVLPIGSYPRMTGRTDGGRLDS